MNRQSRGSRAAQMISLVLLVVLAALAGSSALRVEAHPAQQAPRTVLYLHGRIYTNDPQHPWAAGMAIRDGKIICVGAIAQVLTECPLRQCR